MFQLATSSALTLLCVTGLSLLTAWQLGPEEFGLYAAGQALAVMLMPLASLRLETRLAVCKTHAELGQLALALSSVVVFYLVVAMAVAVLLWLWSGWAAVLWVFCLPAGMVLADFGLARLAYNQQHAAVSVHRFVRQVLPAALGWAAAAVWANHMHALLALLLGTWAWAAVLFWPQRGHLYSLGALRQVWGLHRSGLRASMSLGLLNGLWLNGLQPLMALMGWPQLAGQFALLQRLINAPLSVVTVVVNTLLMGQGNALHTSAKQTLQACAVLALLAGMWVSCLGWVLYVQPFWVVPIQWQPRPEFFGAAAFFGVCSFAVGSISIVSIRLHDEWFVAVWQMGFMLVWLVCAWALGLQDVFALLLWLGGLAYWVLLARWLSKINKLEG